MATIQEIKDIASLVKNATVAGENTAERVGGLFENIAQILQQHEYSIGEKGDNKVLETVKNTANSANSKAEQAQSTVDALKRAFDTIVGSNASEAIDNYNEIIKFLDGLKDSDNLSSILTKLNSALSSTTSIANANKQNLTTVTSDISTLKKKVDAIPATITKFVSMTEAAYEALETKDADTYYMLTEE